MVYPLARGSGPLLSSLVALFLLGERVTLLGALGVAAVVAGVFLIAGGPGLFRAAQDPAKRERACSRAWPTASRPGYSSRAIPWWTATR